MDLYQKFLIAILNVNMVLMDYVYNATTKFGEVNDMVNNVPKIVLYDIETSHNLVATFQLRNQDWINPDNIIQERHLISASWKELGKREVHAVSLLDDPKRFKRDPHDDFHVLAKLHEVLSSADVIVAHNGDNFDLKFTEARFLIQGFPPLPPITKIDTLKVARDRFLFNANNLNYLGQVLKVGKKVETSKGLWLRVLAGEEAAIREMVKYNKQDVLLLEKVFLKLQPYIANHINRQLFGQTGCPRCGSAKVQSRGFHRAISRVYRRFQCQDCAGWFRSQTNEKDVKVTARVL